MPECYCDYEWCAFYHVSVHKAKKNHCCDECGRAIAPGEPYERVRAKWEDIQVLRTCMRCLELREFVQAHVPCFCWYHGNMVEDAIETAREYAYETAGLLFGAYRREILIRRAPRLPPNAAL